MSSTQPVPVPERNPPETRGIAASPQPLPAPRRPRFTIKVKGMIPT